LRVFSDHSTSTFAVAVTPDGSHVVSGDADGIVRVWNLVNGEERFILRGHSAPVTDVSVSADSRFAVSAPGFGDGTLRVWDLSTGRLKPTLRGHTGYVTNVAIVGRYTRCF
jgi:WD40 repeat protein